MAHSYTTKSQIYFNKFTRQYDENDVTIQSYISNVPLVLSIDALEIIDRLISGSTIEDANYYYYEKYSSIPDTIELIDILAQEGFIHSYEKDGNIITIESKSFRWLNTKNKYLNKYHFECISQNTSQLIFSKNNIVICITIIILSLIAIILDPSIIPGWEAHFFKSNITFKHFLLTIFTYFTLFLHEMAHLVAAKAVGVSSRMGISHRLWYLVAETDMTGIWGIPRNQRYLPFLAGPLLDALSSAILILLFFAERHKWISLPTYAIQSGRAMLLVYLLRLLWQCYMFIRTDFYFVFTNVYRCKSLMKDTEVYIWNKISDVFNIQKKVSQSNIPSKEINIIRKYSIFWILGRCAAFYSLISIDLPLNLNYLKKIYSIIANTSYFDKYIIIDAIFMALILLGPHSIGIYLWIKNFRTI